MSRYILGAKPGEYCDHINGNTLDNRRCNLRKVTLSQNAANRKSTSNSTSKYKGVSLDQGGKWKAQIKDHGTKKHIGLYADERQAAIAYNIEAWVCYGKYAKLNNIERTDTI